MKNFKLILGLVMIALTLSCASDDNPASQNHSLVGNWKAIEIYEDPADVWIDLTSPDCPGIVTAKEKLFGNANFTETTFEINMFFEAVDYQYNSECQPGEQINSSGSSRYWGSYNNEPVSVGSITGLMTIEANAEDEFEEWTNPGSYFQFLDENTMIYRLIEDTDDFYFKFKRQ